MNLLWRIARRSFLLWFGAVFLLAGLACFLVGAKGVMEERQFRADSRSVQAVVLRKSIQPAARQGNSSTKYEITYRFTSADGGTVEGIDAVSVETWEALEKGSEIAIRYLPGRPESSRAAESAVIETAIVAVILGVIFAAVGGFFFFRSAAHVWSQWSILRQGDPTVGTAISVEPSNSEINNVRQWEVRYRYRDHFGRTHEGTSGDLAPDEAHAFAIGDAVKVRFDREHPEESAWEGPDSSIAQPVPMTPAAAARAASSWKGLASWATTLALGFAVLAAGEILIPITGLDRWIAQYEATLTAATIGATALGFALFMGGIVYRIFSGGGAPMSHADVEDLARSTRITRNQPYFARASMYRFKGRSVGSSFHDEFSIRDAKEAWKQGAWRASSRWRGNFIIAGGALLFAVGLFSIFVVVGPNGIKLLCAGVIIYVMARTVIAFARA